mgnify:CR=1 FL=1
MSNNLYLDIPWELNSTKPEVVAKLQALKENIYAKNSEKNGKRGAPEWRIKINKFWFSGIALLKSNTGSRSRQKLLEEYRKRSSDKKIRAALRLAKMSNLYFDEHGSSRGDYRYTEGVDFVQPSLSKSSPYWDMGGEGLALIKVHRKRVYAKSSKWYPSSTFSTFLVGKNEAGTYFAHRVVNKVYTVLEAINWIWDGKAGDIMQRQGDIALINGKGPKLPLRIPEGHVITAGGIIHNTHPMLPIPEVGQRIIVGKRAAAHVAAETRD